jgi:hypothetical protein
MRMKRTFFAVAFASAIGIVASVTPAQAEGVMTGSTSHGSVTIQAPDVNFDGPECEVFMPIDMTYTKNAEDVGLDIDLLFKQDGSNYDTSASALVFGSDPMSGVPGNIFGPTVCPGNFDKNAGPIVVTGTLKTNLDFGSEQSVVLSPNGVMRLNLNKTVMSRIKTKKKSASKQSWQLSGKAQAQTITKGLIPVGGAEITTEIRKAGQKKWKKGPSAGFDDFGNWKLSLKGLPPGSVVKAKVTDCAWCTDAQRRVKLR